MFSFIIVNYNTAGLTKACLESIFRFCNEADFEIILVDNNSLKADLNILETEFKNKIKIISNNKNLGFAKANNQGARIASGDYLFFLNSDTVINQDVLNPLKGFFENNDQVGILAPRLILKNGTDQPHAFAYQKKSIELTWVSGAALVIRRNLFIKIGGWEEKFFMYFEDVDLCLKARKNNFKINRLTDVSVTHFLNGSPLPYWKRKIYYYRSKIIFSLKYYLK